MKFRIKYNYKEDKYYIQYKTIFGFWTYLKHNSEYYRRVALTDYAYEEKAKEDIKKLIQYNALQTNRKRKNATSEVFSAKNNPDWLI